MVRGGEGEAGSAIWLTRENVERGSQAATSAAHSALGTPLSFTVSVSSCE